MRNPRVLWAFVFGGLGVLDYVLDRRHDGSTLSEVTRDLFRVHTRTGKTSFTLALTGGGFVLQRHICQGSK